MSLAEYIIEDDQCHQELKNVLNSYFNNEDKMILHVQLKQLKRFAMGKIQEQENGEIISTPLPKETEDDQDRT